MNQQVVRDEKWMRHALDLARLAWGETHPNPMVGAVLVDADNQVISEAHHHRAGEQHAERLALQKVTLPPELARGATLYVTLEPCCTHGRTPPCTDIILEKGIRRVVVGAIDPNPDHCSRGIELLREQGVEVITGVLEGECKALNLIFHHRMQVRTPLIALKTAVTLDGKVATAAGLSKWITGSTARQHVMHWRRYFPAMGVGAGTVLSDNPSLTVREPGREVQGRARYVFDRSLRTVSRLDSLQVFTDPWAEQTCLVTDERHTESQLAPYRSKGIQILQLPLLGDAFPLERFHAHCMQRDITGLYLEGGPGLARSLLAVKGIDYLFHYQAPKLFASHEAPGFCDGLTIERPDDAPFVADPQFEILGTDVLTHGFLNYPAQ